MCSCELLLHLAKLSAFVFAGFAFGIVFGLADRFADFVGLALELFDLGLQLAALRFQIDEPSDVGLHAAVVAVLFDQFGIFDNELPVEHGRVLI